VNQPKTTDPRRKERQERREKDFLSELRGDLVALSQDVRFRRYMAHLVYGRLSLKRGGAWRRDSEIHREAARRDAAAEILAELAEHAPQGFIRLEQEHITRMAEELGRVQQFTEESSDAE
jgi:hypothetical protein